MLQLTLQSRRGCTASARPSRSPAVASFFASSGVVNVDAGEAVDRDWRWPTNLGRATISALQRQDRLPVYMRDALRKCSVRGGFPSIVYLAAVDDSVPRLVPVGVLSGQHLPTHYNGTPEPLPPTGLRWRIGIPPTNAYRQRAETRELRLSQGRAVEDSASVSPVSMGYSGGSTRQYHPLTTTLGNAYLGALALAGYC